MYAMVYARHDLAYASKSIHVKSRKATSGSSEVDVTIAARDCETCLGVSKIGD